MPSSRFAAATSSAPSAAPWVAAVPCLVGAPRTDDRLAADQGEQRVGSAAPSIARLTAPESRPSHSTVCHLGRLVPGHHVLVARQIGRAVDGDPVVVPQDDQPPELQMPREPDRFVVHALHQVAVAGDDEGTVVDQSVTVDRVQMPLGDRHSDRHRHALPERAGGDLDSRQLEILRVPGGRACRAGGSA